MYIIYNLICLNINMNQQSITTPDKTVLLKYTLPYILYNLICFYKYIIFIYSITVLYKF